jgi:hypothetical protein
MMGKKQGSREPFAFNALQGGPEKIQVETHRSACLIRALRKTFCPNLDLR